MTLWSDVATVVADGVRVVPGDRVSVFLTDTDAAPAAEAFVEEVYRRGGVPQVVAADERYERAALAFASDAVLSAPAPLEELALGWSTKHVSFRGMVPPPAEQPDAGRLAQQRHGKGLVSARRWNQEGWALVRVPTQGWAAMIGADPDALLAEWAAGCLQDWAAARARQRVLCDLLEQHDELLIRDHDTELVVPFTGRSWLTFAGEANFPDGEIATAPLDDGAVGHITFPGSLWFGGARIDDLRLEFEAGHVVAAAATRGEDVVRALIASDEGAARIGELGIGTNAAMRTMTGDLLLDEKILGTAHIALGRAYPECGGVNRSALHWDIVKDLRGPDGGLRADDLPLISGGAVEEALASGAQG